MSQPDGNHPHANGHKEPTAPADASTTQLSGLSAPGGVDEAESGRRLSDADKLAVSALQPGTALLIVQRGANAGARFLLDSASVTVGRHPHSDIFLDDVTVSRKHAQFERAGGSFQVHDVGSLNGTYVNRQRIDSTTLHDGDEVQIGKFRLVFHPGPPERGQA